MKRLAATARRLGLISLHGLLLASWIGCAGEESVLSDPVVAEAMPSVVVPDPDTRDMEPALVTRIAELQAAIKASPRSAAAWGRLGKLLHAQSLHEPAIVAYREARRLSPRDERWSYFLGDALAIEGSDPEAAEAAFLATLELRPGYAPAFMRLGQVRFQSGDGPGAETAFLEALRLQPGLAPATLGLGQTQLAQAQSADVSVEQGASEKLEQAVATLESAREQLPRSPTVHFALSRAYRLQGRGEEAAAAAELAQTVDGVDFYEDPLLAEVEREAMSSSVLLARARDNIGAENWRAALADLQRVETLLPEDPDVHQLLAAALGETGNLGAAIAHLQKTLLLAPDRDEIRAQLALLQLQAERPREAWETLQRALERQPEDRGLRAIRGRAWLAGGHLQPAVDEFAELAATGPVEPWVHDEWGTALARQGRFTEAIDHFEVAVELEPDNAQALFHLGLALEGAGRPAEAVVVYREAMSIEPNPLVRSRIEALEGS